MKKDVIIPSIIARSQKELDKRLKKVSSFCSVYQIDVMDGKFVKSSSFDFDFVLPRSNHKVEAHLMVQDPLVWIENNFRKVHTIIIHVESLKIKDKRSLKKIVSFIKSKKKRVGFAIKPRTNISFIKSFIKGLDMVTIMTVHPGKYGSKFLPSSLKKVSELRSLYPQLNIEVDGGITLKTIHSAKIAGANQFISGSYLQKSKNIKAALDKLFMELKK